MPAGAGGRYFADRLNDDDLAANNGGWQRAASTGCGAQSYFRQNAGVKITNTVNSSSRPASMAIVHIQVWKSVSIA